MVITNLAKENDNMCPLCAPRAHAKKVKIETIVSKIVHSTFKSQNFVVFYEKFLILNSLTYALKTQDNKTH